MKYIYDTHTIQPGESPTARANQWGQDGWRWVNTDAVPWQTHTMIFELVVEDHV